MTDREPLGRDWSTSNQDAPNILPLNVFSGSENSLVNDSFESDDEDRMSTINPIQEAGDLPPLFCMPAADGLTLVYHQLSQELGLNQPVYGLDSPAIYREPIPETLEELSARFIRDMKEIQPEGPYLIVGYCSGGTTALEVAQQLIQSGDQVALLALLETYNWNDAPSTNPSLWTQIHFQYERVKFHILNFLKLRTHDKREFLGSKVTALKNRLGVLKGKLATLFSKKRIDKTAMVNMNEIWKKHDEIAEAYLAARYPGRLIHFRPIKDYSAHLGSELVADEIVMRRLDCYPAGMMSMPFVKTLAEEMKVFIREGLEKAQQEAPVADPFASSMVQARIS